MSDEEAPGQTRYLPCRWCDVATPHATLVALGARCSRCFAAYCRTKPVLPMGHFPQGRSPEWLQRKARAQTLRGVAESAPPPPAVAKPLSIAPAPEPATDDAPGWVFDDEGAGA